MTCGYCSMKTQKELWRGEDYTPEEVTPDVWIRALERVEPTRPDFVVNPCNAEPALYKGCAEIINSIPQWPNHFYTNCSTESMEEIKLMKPRNNLVFYVSFHHGQISVEEFIENALWLKAHFKISNFHAPAYPPFKDLIAADAAKMKKAGITLVTNHEFLGWYKGKLYTSYLGEGQWAKDAVAWRDHGAPKRTVLCKTSFNHSSYFSRTNTVAPNGNIYTCWRYLYNHSDEGILGNFFDPEFQFKDEFFECKHYGDCNICAWHRMIYDKETGEKIDDDIMEESEKNSISACMIVRDEEQSLEDCLMSLQGWVNEIILVDTGSTDKTLEIARKYNCRIFQQKWEDDFSYHRNFSIDQATKEWIFIIDADERVHPHDVAIMKQLLTNVKQDVIGVDLLNLYGKPPVVKSTCPSLRFFRRSYGIRYRRPVHNAPVIKKDTVVYRVPFKIYHLGYDMSPEIMARKFERTAGLCRQWTEKEPDNPEAWWQMARSIMVKDGKFNVEDKEEILACLEKSISLCNGNNTPDNTLLQALNLMGWVKYVLQDHEEAVRYGKRAVNLKRDYLDAILLIGLGYMHGIDAKEGEVWLKKYLEEQELYDFSARLDSLVMEHANDRAFVHRKLAEIEDWKSKKLLNMK